MWFDSLESEATFVLILRFESAANNLSLICCCNICEIANCLISVMLCVASVFSVKRNGE